MNGQLSDHNIIVKTGAIVDASIVDTPLRPKGKTNYKVTEDRKEETALPALQSVGKSY